MTQKLTDQKISTTLRAGEEENGERIERIMVMVVLRVATTRAEVNPSYGEDGAP